MAKKSGKDSAVEPAREDSKKIFIRDFVITDEFATVGEDMTVRDAVRALLDMKRGVLLIKKGESKVVGVVTERKILKGIVDAKDDPLDSPVSKVMDTKIMYIRDDEELEIALEGIKSVKPAAVIVNDKDGGFMGYFSPVDYIEAEHKLKAMKKD
jgi:predicted transcriptional regulator